MPCLNRRIAPYVVLALLTLPGVPAAQNFGAAPANGTASLRPDAAFAEDIEISVPAVGEPPQTNDAGCSGQYILERPEINLDVEGAARPLRIYARSSHDTVLMVRTPAGEWMCNDDTDGTNPSISLEPASPGVYHVWVGPYYSAGDNFPVTLYADAGGSAMLDPVAAPTAGSANLGAPIQPDPREMTIEVGADVSHEVCPGFYSQAPTFNLNYDGTGPLYIFARTSGEDDLTLAVNGPDGLWSCNDDADGLNPGIVYDEAIAGLYGVWVGSFRSRARTEPSASATLLLSSTEGPDPADMMDEEPFEEVDFPEGYSGGEDFDRDGVPTAGTLSFGGGDPLSVVVSAGGPTPNSVIGVGCAGFVDPARPTAMVDFTSAGGVLSVWAVSDSDATLVLGLPDGTWVCNDDYNGLMPAIVVDRALPGRYPVWVGTFVDEPASATLFVSGGEPFEP
jgi:hypothetical protein